MADWKTNYEAWPEKTTLPITDKRAWHEIAGYQAGYLSASTASEARERELREALDSHLAERARFWRDQRGVRPHENNTQRLLWERADAWSCALEHAREMLKALGEP